ncbi:hypothetical protein Y032_0032g2560 [Ancylostoma ceylanicum]|uniref:Uncharacterized protein n=1 Tax=Ancylostoma ceylanicum TaxID=53326 RepID=A0A016UPQ1_9BILA|nr:hypothetical protein Y032_0032g2560 [Ancylostoma ceylanicum]
MTETLLLVGSKHPLHGAVSGLAPSCAICPPQQQRRVNTSWPIRLMTSTVSHVFARNFVSANWYKPRDKRV